MPDFDLDAVRARQAAARASAAVELDQPTTFHLAPDAIANCPLCDDEGYFGNRVCDHVDHAAATTNGRAAARKALADIAARRHGAAHA